MLLLRPAEASNRSHACLAAPSQPSLCRWAGGLGLETAARRRAWRIFHATSKRAQEFIDWQSFSDPGDSAALDRLGCVCVCARACECARVIFFSLSIFIPLFKPSPGRVASSTLSLPCKGSQRLAPGMFRTLEPSVSRPGSVWATVLSPGLTLSPRECCQATVCCPFWVPISEGCSGDSLHPEPSLKRET